VETVGRDLIFAGSAHGQVSVAACVLITGLCKNVCRGFCLFDYRKGAMSKLVFGPASEKQRMVLQDKTTDVILVGGGKICASTLKTAF
jgi:hypothetical protein